MISSSFASLALLGLLATAWAVEPSCADADGASCAVEEDSSLLMLNRKDGGKQGRKREYKPRDIQGKSLYFVVTDYFAGPPAGQPVPANCEGHGWCNGTIKGITNKLDYIQGMGFEGIWVTPLIKQFYGPDPDGRSGYGQYGYWAEDWYKIDPNYGTAEELKELTQELHKRDMVFVYDIVLNHVGPVHSEADLAKFSPFNKPEHLHQRGIGDMTFDEYTKGYAYGGKGYPPPVQGIGPGAMCIPGPEGCSNYHCPVDAGFGHPCPMEPTFLGDMNPPQHAPGPREIPNCGVGDLVCAGYDEEQTIEGWFYDLGDLNHSHPFVHDELIKWGTYMRDTYHIDGFRLDTAPYVSKEFLSDFQAAVKIPILGEVTTSNWTFFKSYAPPPAEGPVLKGLLNFYIQNVATPAFCGPPAFFPGADLNLSSLAANLGVMDLDKHLEKHGLYDMDLLGNFVDNHDTARLALYCGNVMSRMKNALAFTMLARGIPIIYSGTEHFFNSTHPAMWNSGYATDTPGYTFIRNLNNARKSLQLHTPTGMKVQAADENRLIFSRHFYGESRHEKDPCAKSPNPAYGAFADPCCENLKGPGCNGQLPVGCAAGGLPQVCRYCFLPGSYLDDGSLPVCPESVKKKDVLLIIDMLKDYSVAYNKRTYGFLRNPFLDESAPPIEDAMKEQVKVVKSKTKHWDTIVFTQDWLIPSIIASIGFPGAEIENHSFCIRDTPGAEPFDALTAAASQRKAKQIRFKKNRNNVFTTDVPNPDIGAEYQKKAKEDPDMYPSVPEDYPNRGFDVDDAFSNSTFQEMLDDLGHTAEAVKLTVVGTIADMCVLTSTVNALYHGYEVQVYVPGLNGGAEEAEPGWAACVHGQPGSGACCVPLPEEIARSPKSHQGWQERVYACQSAAGYKNALEYMRLAGAELLWTVP